jgi:hypothetical protein
VESISKKKQELIEFHDKVCLMSGENSWDHQTSVSEMPRGENSDAGMMNAKSHDLVLQ